MYRNAEAAERAMKASPISFVFGEVGIVMERGDATVTDSRVLEPVGSNQDNQVVMSSIQERNDGDTGEKPMTHDPNATAWASNTMSSSTSAGSSSTRSRKWPYPNLHTSSASPSLASPSYAQAGLSSQSSNREPQLTNNSSELRREVSLSVSPSGLNHHSYIARQYYYGQWWPNTRTIPGDDLSQRAPIQGLSDVRMDMPEVPVRLRMKREQEAHLYGKSGLRRLREIWERGMHERGEGIRNWAGEGVKMNKGSRTVAIDDNS